MSIAGDTQARVPGFYSRPETILSPRKGGVFLAAAENPNYFTALQTVNATNNINVGGNITSAGNNNISIGGTIGGNPGGNSSVAILGTVTANQGDSVAIRGTASSGNGHLVIMGTINTGQENIAIGRNSEVSFASGNTPNSCIAIGNSVIVNQGFCTAIGPYGRVDTIGEIAFNNGDSGIRGDSRYSIIICRRTTVDATPTELGTTDGVVANPANRLVCTNNTTYIYDVDIVVRNTANTVNCAAYNLKFAFNRGANAASSTISPLSKTIIYTLGTTTGWDVTATADTTNGRPNITVTGAASTSLKWLATVKMTKVTN